MCREPERAEAKRRLATRLHRHADEIGETTRELAGALEDVNRAISALRDAARKLTRGDEQVETER